MTVLVVHLVHFLLIIVTQQVLALQIEHCESKTTLVECTAYCKGYNLPLHFYKEKQDCCCKNDLDPQPGYIVIWDEGKKILTIRKKRRCPVFDYLDSFSLNIPTTI